MQSEPTLFHNLIWKSEEAVASIFRCPSCIYSPQGLTFKLGEAVRHMSSSFSLKHIGTKVKKLPVDMASCSLIFKLRLLFQPFCMLVCAETP